MAITLIATTSMQTPVGAPSGGSITTPAINTTGANAIFVYTNVYGITTLTDSAGNSWVNTPPTPYNDGSGLTGSTGTIWYAVQPIRTSASHTFTAGGFGLTLLVSAWRDVVPSLPYDTESAGSHGSGATRATGPVTPRQTNSLIFAVTGDEWLGTLTVDSGFTLLGTAYPFITDVAHSAGWAYLVQAAPATVNPTFAYSAGANLAQARAAVFKGPPPPRLAPRLALDDVVCTTIQALGSNLISLRWSDDRGRSFGSPVTQPIGDVGEYRTSLQWQRLAYARDRVFEISWSVPMATALQGCWIDVTPAGS
jgi:hypothetical protein